MTLFGQPREPFSTFVYINYEQRLASGAIPDREFLQQTRRALRRIAQTRVGHTILAQLPSLRVTITPKESFVRDFGEWDESTAAATAFCVSLDPQAATARGEPERYGVDDPSTPDVDEAGTLVPGGFVGTGAGSDAVIYIDWAACSKHIIWPDAILLHELGHALRATLGANTSRSVGWMPGGRHYFPNTEELFADLIQNMYVVERGGTPTLGYYQPEHVEQGRAYDLRTGRVRPPTSVRVTPGSTYWRPWYYGHLRQLMIRSLAMRRVMWVLHQLPRDAVPYNPFRDIDEFEHGRFVPHTARDR